MTFGRSILALLLCCAGCSKDWRPVDAKSLRESGPRSIALAISNPPGFYAQNAGTRVSMAFGLVGAAIGAAAASARGEAVLETNSIPDPGRRIGLRLVQAFAHEQRLSIRPTQLIGIDELPDPHFDADLVLIARTERWGFSAASEASGYQLYYAARIELHDLREKRILAEGDCQPPAWPEREGRSYQQLVERRAQLLKLALARQAEICLRRFGAELLGTKARISLDAPDEDAAEEGGDERSDPEEGDERE